MTKVAQVVEKWPKSVAKHVQNANIKYLVKNLVKNHEKWQMRTFLYQIQSYVSKVSKGLLCFASLGIPKLLRLWTLIYYERLSDFNQNQI